MTQKLKSDLIIALGQTVYQNTQRKITGSSLAAFLRDVLDSVSFAADYRQAPQALPIIGANTFQTLTTPFLATAPALVLNGLIYFPPAFTLAPDGLSVTWNPVAAGSASNPMNIFPGFSVPVLIAL